MVNQKAIVASHVRRNSSIFLTRQYGSDNWYARRLKLAGDDAWEGGDLARAHMLSKLEASDASEHMLDEWDQRRRRVPFRHCRRVRLTICYRCVNAYLTGGPLPLYLDLRETVLLSVEMLEDKHIQHHTLASKRYTGARAARASD